MPHFCQTLMYSMYKPNIFQSSFSISVGRFKLKKSSCCLWQASKTSYLVLLPSIPYIVKCTLKSIFQIQDVFERIRFKADSMLFLFALFFITFAKRSAFFYWTLEPQKTNLVDNLMGKKHIWTLWYMCLTRKRRYFHIFILLKMYLKRL